MESNNIPREYSGLTFNRGALGLNNLSNYCTSLCQRGDRQARGETDGPEGKTDS